MLFGLLGCARELTPEERTLAILAEHRIASLDVSAASYWVFERGAMVVRLLPAGEGRVRVDWSTTGGQGPQRTTGTLDGGILTLAEPLSGSTRFHFCRFGDDDWLASETHVSFPDLEHPMPTGLVLSRFQKPESRTRELGGRAVPFSGPDEIDEDVRGQLGHD